jgi:hypothetical protein
LRPVADVSAQDRVAQSRPAGVRRLRRRTRSDHAPLVTGPVPGRRRRGDVRASSCRH